MSVQAMSWVLDHSEARLGARLVLIAIANHADADGGNSWASVGRLAAETRMSRRAVQDSLRSLEDFGEIEEVERHAKRGTHVYRLPLMGAQILHPGGADASPGGAQNPTGGGADSSPEPSIEPSLEPSSNSLDEAFDEFWKTYPRHGGVSKQAAKDAFRQRVNGTKKFAPTPVETILDGARRYAADPNLPGDETYVRHPKTWLNQSGWEDDPLPPRRGDRAADDGDDLVRHLTAIEGGKS